MGFLYKMLKYQMNMYEIREVMALFGFVQSLGFCTEFWDKLEPKKLEITCLDLPRTSSTHKGSSCGEVYLRPHI